MLKRRFGNVEMFISCIVFKDWIYLRLNYWLFLWITIETSEYNDIDWLLENKRQGEAKVV